MPHPLTSKKRAKTLSSALCLIGLAILAITGEWWPGIMLVVGASLALRQYLLGRFYDMLISLAVFVGTFAFVQFEISWQVFLPTIFTLAAIYLLFREFTESRGETEEEHEDDLNHEIEEQNPKKK